MTDLPFDGAISAFFENDAPKSVRNAIKRADKNDIINPDYPYSEFMPRKAYDKEIELLQIELVKMQSWARETNARIAVVFEGRDAAVGALPLGEEGVVGRRLAAVRAGVRATLSIE